MTYKYQIKKGHEARIFAGARNLGNGIVESDEELNSAYLTLIKDGDQMTAEKPADIIEAPAQPLPPITNTPVAGATSVTQPDNKETN